MLRSLNKVITNDAHANNLLVIAKIISSFSITIDAHGCSKITMELVLLK